jgi:phosphatidylglycerol lysyltransferase
MAGSARVILRLSLPLAAVLVSGAILSAHFADLPHNTVLDGILALPLPRLACALLLVAAAFVAVAGQERAVMTHLGIVVPPGHGRAAAAATATVSQMVGFGPFVGAIVRRRLLPHLTLAQSFQVSVGITLGFFGGLALMWLALVAGQGSLPAAAAFAALVAGYAALAALQRSLGLGLRLPNLIVAGRFMGWLAIDLLALGSVFWLVLPDATLSLAQVLPVFLLALGAGFLSGSPAGAGLFEATVVSQLPQVAADDMLVGIILFRMLAFAVPATIGAVYACVAPWIWPVPEPAAAVAAGTALPAPRMAEVGLAHQGELAPVTVAPGSIWLAGALPHSLVALGDPWGNAGASGAVAAFAAHARADGRLACLYKCSPRLAAAARRAGFLNVPVAREAVLDPYAFHTGGPARSGLRRKLNHARKAGVTTSRACWTAIDDMNAVAIDWRAHHGRERGFSTGRWMPDVVHHQAVFTARAGDGRLLAFVTFHMADAEWTLDLVRQRRDAPDGTIPSLVVCALAEAKARGVRRLSLAAVPEAVFTGKGLVGRMVRRRFSGLWQFKAAFAPRWERRYMAAPSMGALAVAAAEVVLAVHRPPPLRLPRPISAAAAPRHQS